MSLSSLDSWLNGRSFLGAVLEEERALAKLGWLDSDLQNGKKISVTQIVGQTRKEPFFQSLHVVPVSVFGEEVLRTLLYCGSLSIKKRERQEECVTTDLHSLNEFMTCFDVFEILIIDPLVEVIKTVDMFNFIAVTFILLRQAFVFGAFPQHSTLLCPDVCRVVELHVRRRWSSDCWSFAKMNTTVGRRIIAGWCFDASCMMSSIPARDNSHVME